MKINSSRLIPRIVQKIKMIDLLFSFVTVVPLEMFLNYFIKLINLLTQANSFDQLFENFITSRLRLVLLILHVSTPGNCEKLLDRIVGIELASPM